MKRAIAIILAAGALCLVVAALLARHDLLERYYVYQITRDESRFDELLREGGELKRRALKRYLRTAKGREFLQRRCQELLGRVSDIYRSSWGSSYPIHMEKWRDGTSRGSFVALADQHFLYLNNPGKRDRIIWGSADLDQLSAFLEIADESLGQKFVVPDSPGITVEILTTREALQRADTQPDTANPLSRTPPLAGKLQQIAWMRRWEALGIEWRASTQTPPRFRQIAESLGDHPALFYSRE